MLRGGEVSCSQMRAFLFALTSVIHPKVSLRYDKNFTLKTMRHPTSVMVWGCYSGNMGKGDLNFLPKNVTMRGDNYVNVLKDHLIPFLDKHSCHTFSLHFPL